MEIREPRCRAGHPNCCVPWGYDEAHADSDRPYTLDELAERETAPHRYAYPTLDEYLFGFKLWRSLRRDARLTYDENDIVWRWQVEKMASELNLPDLLDLLGQRR